MAMQLVIPGSSGYVAGIGDDLGNDCQQRWTQGNNSGIYLRYFLIGNQVSQLANLDHFGCACPIALFRAVDAVEYCAPSRQHDLIGQGEDALN